MIKEIALAFLGSFLALMVAILVFNAIIMGAVDNGFNYARSEINNMSFTCTPEFSENSFSVDLGGEPVYCKIIDKRTNLLYVQV